MQDFKSYITERFINLQTPDSKMPYAQDVFDMIQLAYKDIGGIRGSGFNSPSDMIKNIPFWKLIRKDNKIVTAVLYKDKNGRKLVCVATNGTPDGKRGLAEILKTDLSLNRSYMEVSCTLLSFIVKLIGYELLLKYAQPIEYAQKILKSDTLEPADPQNADVKKHPVLNPYFYQREIGGKMSVKIMLGHQ